MPRVFTDFFEIIDDEDLCETGREETISLTIDINNLFMSADSQTLV